MEELARLTDIEAAKIAIGVEENGIAFYEAVRKRTRDRKTADLLQHLVEQEKEHKELFESIEKKLLGRGERYWDDPSTTEYVRAILSPGIFPSRGPTRGAAGMAEGRGLPESRAETLAFALQIEKDSVLFYDVAASKASQAETRATFRAIGDEERQHVLDIARLMASQTTPP